MADVVRRSVEVEGEPTHPRRGELKLELELGRTWDQVFSTRSRNRSGSELDQDRNSISTGTRSAAAELRHGPGPDKALSVAIAGTLRLHRRAVVVSAVNGGDESGSGRLEVANGVEVPPVEHYLGGHGRRRGEVGFLAVRLQAIEGHRQPTPLARTPHFLPNLPRALRVTQILGSFHTGNLLVRRFEMEPFHLAIPYLIMEQLRAANDQDRAKSKNSGRGFYHGIRESQ